MRHPHASFFDPDKIIKDILWNDMAFASGFAHGKLLDIGCGDKPYQRFFLKTVTSYVGLDARNPHADIQKDIRHTHIPKESYDTILSTQVIEHVPDPKQLLRIIHKILKKNGTCIITAPLVAALHEEPYDYYRFTKYGLKTLFTEAGFEILCMKEQGNWISSNLTMMAFHLEIIANRFFLRYPKKLVIACLMLLGTCLSHLPPSITKPKQYPMNYLVIAKKR